VNETWTWVLAFALALVVGVGVMWGCGRIMLAILMTLDDARDGRRTTQRRREEET
jgi:hypothetical protein